MAKMILNSLFAPADKKSSAEDSQNKVNSILAIRQGETYQQYGVRTCGVVSGNRFSLPSYLHKIYTSLKADQLQNVELQQQQRKQIQGDIDRKSIGKKSLENKKSKYESDIEDCKVKISTNNLAISKIKENEKKVNKDEKLKRNIGLLILVPLTVYLFVFYSSTFYSAFFRDPQNIQGLGNAMFDPDALINAYGSGVTELMFCLLAPVIFLALGYILHIFTKENGVGKYFKVCAIVLVTLMFDMILAFKIGDQLHQLAVITGSAPLYQSYAISMAVEDVNTWAVIFLGFISYIIWGLVFDMTMDAHQKIDENKTEIKRLQKLIADLNKDISEYNLKIGSVNNDIVEVDKDIVSLQSKLASNAVFLPEVIKTELNNFFSGWLAQMKLLSLQESDFEEAQSIYDRQMGIFFTNPKPINSNENENE